jgi:NADP-dependent 3-hydroxy acid dehydrogenase YdfG|tara:strand:- start:8881 stop:9585 length:705 start_codon:yes stop_codon:yes gene_type:complete
MRNKRIVVIGGTSGYGKGIAKKLTDQGNNVFCYGRTSEQSLDVRNEKDIIDVLKKIEEIDVVIYSAGLGIGKSYVADKDVADFKQVFEVNTLGLLSTLKHSFKYLKKTKGHFIHIGSIAHELSYVGGADYCASKSASNTIMKTIRKEWLGTGIKTSSLEVGLGNTKFQENRYKGDEVKALKHTTGVRQIEPEDLGETVAFLLAAPDYLNFDEVVLKPIDQASHGISINDIEKLF